MSLPKRELIVEYYGPNGRELITEGFKETAVNAVQYIISAAAEYGIALGTFGGGLAGPAEAVETLIDMAFSAESIASTVAALTNVSGLTKEGQQIVGESQKLFPTLPRSLEEFYNSVKGIVGHIMKGLGAGAVDMAEELKKVLEDLLDKASDGIGDMIKSLIPDATIGLAVATAVGLVISQATKNIYDLIKVALQKAGKFAMWILDPQNVMSFFDQQYPALIALCRQISQKISSMGVIASAGLAASGMGIAVRAFGPAGFNKLADWLTAAQSKVRSVLESIVKIALPFFMLFSALLQILMKGDYEQSTIQQAADIKGKVKGGVEAVAKGVKDAGGAAGIRKGAANAATWVAKKALNESQERGLSLQRVDERIRALELTINENSAKKRSGTRINENVLRRMVREEMESIE